MHPALRVLIVDDNEKTRLQLVNIIRPETTEIMECASSMDALGEYGVHRPDWVLMDADVKTMDGLTAASLIHDYYPKAKVMIVSHEDTPVLNQTVRNAGVSAFVNINHPSEILSRLSR
jgi:CheY-like chemotaxis protein